MAKIVGNTVGVPNPVSDFAQNDPTKADYIKNRPVSVEWEDKELKYPDDALLYFEEKDGLFVSEKCVLGLIDGETYNLVMEWYDDDTRFDEYQVATAKATVDEDGNPCLILTNVMGASRLEIHDRTAASVLNNGDKFEYADIVVTPGFIGYIHYIRIGGRVRKPIVKQLSGYYISDSTRQSIADDVLNSIPEAENGLSAYEIAIQNGFEGTEEEWLESLVGVTPNIIIGNVNTVDGSEDATVTRRDGSPDESPIFDFDIPRGLSGVYVGSGEMPEGYNIQIDPNGTETEVTISADTIYDLVINSQAEWDAAVASSFGGAKNVLLNCDIEINESICNHLPVVNIWVTKLEYDTSIKETVMKNVKVDAYAFPNTLKSIAGNGHNINFNLSADARGDYAEDDYIKYFSFRNCSIKDVQFNVLSGVISLCNINGMFDCSCNVDYYDDEEYYEVYNYHMFTIESSTNIHRFNGGAQFPYSSCVIYDCSDIYNSSIWGHEASYGTGFNLCNNLVSCEADSYDAAGFSKCTNLIGCNTFVYDSYGSNPSGYQNCEQLVNCKASVNGGYGYRNCSCMSNCIAELDGGVSGFTGANTYCDSETCKEIEFVYE